MTVDFVTFGETMGVLAADELGPLQVVPERGCQKARSVAALPEDAVCFLDDGYAGPVE